MPCLPHLLLIERGEAFEKRLFLRVDDFELDSGAKRPEMLPDYLLVSYEDRLYGPRSPRKVAGGLDHPPVLPIHESDAVGQL